MHEAHNLGPGARPRTPILITFKMIRSEGCFNIFLRKYSDSETEETNA